MILCTFGEVHVCGCTSENCWFIRWLQIVRFVASAPTPTCKKLSVVCYGVLASALEGLRVHIRVSQKDLFLSYIVYAVRLSSILLNSSTLCCECLQQFMLTWCHLCVHFVLACPIQGTSAEELGGLTNRICSPVDQSEHSESHDDHMDTGEPPSGIVHVDSTATSLPHPQEGDSDADVTCVSHDDHMLISSSGDVASHDHSFQSLPPLHSLPPGHSFPAASTLSSFASSDDTHAADLFSLPLPPLPSNEDSSRSVLPLCGMEGVTSIGALLEEMERSEHAGGEALSVKATSDKVDQIRAAFALEEDEGASMDSELQGEAAPVAADLPTQLLAEGVVCCPIPLRSPLKTTASPLGAAMMMSSPQHGQQKASLLSLELSDQSPFKVVQQQQQVALPQAGGEGTYMDYSTRQGPL